MEYETIVTSRDGLAGEVARLGASGARLIMTVGTDVRPLGGGFEVTHLFGFDRAGKVVGVVVPVPADDPTFPAVTPQLPPAGWMEREVYDMIGVTPEGHPDLRRLIVADDWPDDVFPLRKDVPHNYRPPRAENARSALKPTPEGTTVVPVGPFFPTLEEPAYFRLFVEGEEVVDCDYRGFYSHRGVEKLAEQLRYDQIPFLAERICGICGYVHSTCFSQAVEQAAGIEVPRRGRYIRTIMLELERIHSHLLWLGLAAHIVGFDTGFMQAWRVREPVMWAAEALTGNRKTYGMNLPGGVRRDLRPEGIHQVQDVLKAVERESQSLMRALERDTALRSRLRNTGVLTHEKAVLWGAVGPTARASGVDIDVRRDYPYAAYDELPVNVALRQEGDIWARLEVRVEETLESVRLIREALANLPGGPTFVEPGEVPEGRVSVVLVEAPRGELCNYLMTGAEGKPYRWRVRVPTYMNLQLTPQMVNPGTTIADFPIIAASIDPCFSCTERMEIVRRPREGRHEP
ncbi:Ni,Fe-hydrogenase III large subunit/Ni,Fe-hydrogenase III component G [Symbiobacterium terraclitae]|uniref:Ni,Fe-hydrogenase III large subunit/Ni,Fe-hydrogenase III component G n=1 Tax=Symbiobacterium terraclitae TaxID=557451 RepID=A0ABS4JTP9_9FIRM|nr:NADH-quinone oxidoreductase subunit C [Symbiobacterium terraclitae]MBP2018903.1 Ni,Fe-hydrogenase III large subunit/Ni,Fe-hydrogenase III component G [Symbiobacterium terraclitae]